MKRISKYISLLLVLLIMVSSSLLTVQAASESDIRSKIISIADNEVGYKGSGTYSKYGEWYGYQGAWCTTFVLWVFNKAGNDLGVDLYGNIVPSGGNCNSMISWFKNRDRYHTRSSGYKAKKGDLIFFDWSGNGSSQHVGIVDYIDGSNVHTIEGNCSGEVKARTYTTTGSKPYNNISAIMGYGSPDYASVSSGNNKTTAAKTTAKTTQKKTTQKQTTKKPAPPKTTEKTTAKATQPQTSAPVNTVSTTTTKAADETSETTTTTTTTTTKPETTIKSVKKLKLHAATNELQIGDSVKLDYSIEPANTKAVVGYFCDEENIIEISNGGDIKAIGEGRATVVVCANDEVYSQCDFVVTLPSSDVTKHGNQFSYVMVAPDLHPTTQLPSEKTYEQKLNDMGINLAMLKNNKELYIMPLIIVCSTLVLSALVAAVKAIANRRRRKHDNSDQQ